MSTTNASLAEYEPGVTTVELVCERLGELGLAIGPDVARELVRSILATELPRMDARIRDALETSLQTIRVAAQSAMGVLGAISPAASPAPAAPARSPGRKTPLPAPPAPRRPVPKRQAEEPGDDSDEGERRPVFKRRRGY